MISIIFPTYNEEDNLELLHAQITQILSKIPDETFEIIFVDDGSSDSTPDVLSALKENDARIKIIRFSRNCGSHAAISAGLHFTKADCAVVLAADLQDPPQLVKDLVGKWREGAKVVWGARSKRKGINPFFKFCSKFYYTLINKTTSIKMPPLGADVFLVDRVVIEAFKNIPEKNASVFMTLAWLGFRQETIHYVKEARHKGYSKWTLTKRIKLALDSLISFSDFPIRFMSMLGFLTAFLGFFYALFVFLKYLLFGTPVVGWSSLIIVVLVIGGVQMTMLGVLGEYLWRTYDEARGRPRYVIESIRE